MSTPSDTRCVWLTEDQAGWMLWAADMLRRPSDGIAVVGVRNLEAVKAAWDAADPDPAQAVVEGYARVLHTSDPQVMAESVLVALGWSQAAPATGSDT